MAQEEKLINKPVWSSPALSGFIWVLDPNDTTDSPEGTDKRVDLSNLPVDWSNVQNKPSAFPSDWSSVANKPDSFDSDWSQIDNIPGSLMHTNQDVTITADHTFNKLPAISSSDIGAVGGVSNVDLSASQLIKLSVEGPLFLNYSNPKPNLYTFIFRHTANSNTLGLQSGKFRYANGAAPSFSTTATQVDVMVCYFNAVDGVMEILYFLNNVQTS